MHHSHALDSHVLDMIKLHRYNTILMQYTMKHKRWGSVSGGEVWFLWKRS